MIDTQKIWDTLTFGMFAERSLIEQHIALFGESGSGKTTLLSTFYGWQQEREVKERCGYGLLADDTTTGQRLKSDYLKLVDDLLPPVTRYDHTATHFTIKVRGLDSSPGKLIWHDYPGEWWQETKTGEEGTRKIEGFKKLLKSDVALILCDGLLLKKNDGKYLKGLFRGFHEELERQKKELMSDGKPLKSFPRVWIICLSKADLFPDKDVTWFKDMVLRYASDELKELREVIGGIVAEKKCLSIGEDFLLLSSAEFDPNTGKVKDAKKHMGLELIMPMAVVLPVKRMLTWCKAAQGGSWTVRFIADLARSITTGWMKYIPIIGNIFEALDDAAKKGIDAVKDIEKSARESGNSVEAAIAAMTARFYDKETKRVYYSSKDFN